MDDKTLAADLHYVPPYSYAIAVIRPQQIVRLLEPGDDASPNAATLRAMAELVANPQFRAKDMVRFVTAVYPDSSLGALAAGHVLELSDTVERRSVIDWLSPGAEPSRDNHLVYLPIEDGRPCLGFPNERTVVIGRYAYVGPMLDARRESVEGRLWPQLHRTPDGSQAFAAIDVDRIRHFVTNNRGGYLADRQLDLMFAKMKLPSTLDRIAGAVDLRHTNGLWLDATARDPGVDSEMLANDMIGVLKDQVARSKASVTATLGADFSSTVESLVSMASGLINSLQPQNDSTDGALEEAMVDSVEGAPPALQWRSDALPDASTLLAQTARALSVGNAFALKRQIDHQASASLPKVVLAMERCYETTGQLPQDIVGDDGEPLLSWRVALLPWIGEVPLFELFRFDEPWDSEHNLALLNQMPEVYRSRGAAESMTTLQRIVGKDSFGSAKSFEDLPDGASRTLALIESVEATEWTRPADFDITTADIDAKLRADGSWGVLANLSTVLLKPGSSDELRQLGNRRDGLPKLASSSLGDEYADDWADQPLSTEQLTSLLERIAMSWQSLSSQDSSSGEASLLKELGQLRAGAPRRVDDRESHQVFKAIVPLLDSLNGFVRGEALRALVNWQAVRTESAWSLLLPSLQDSYEMNRWLAATLLSNIIEPDVVRAFVEMPAQDVSLVGSIIAASPAIQAIAADAVAPLVDDENPESRIKAYQLIAAFGDERHRELLELGLADRNPSCRQVASDSLDQLPELGPIRAAIQDSSGNVLEAVKRVAVDVRVTDQQGEVELWLNEDGAVNYSGRLRDSDLAPLGQLTNLVRLDLTSTFVSSVGVAHLRRLAKLRELDLNYAPRIDDEVGVELAHLQALEVLALDHTKFGDRGVVSLGQLPQLRSLNLDSTDVTDDAFSTLAVMQTLEDLSIGNSRVTDRGLAALAEHPALRSLLISNTSVTDEGLKYLESIKNLEYVNVRGTNVTLEGVKALRAVFPTIEIAIE